MNSHLQKLENNRPAILTAEIGVWLHLLGKLSEEFIFRQSAAGQPPQGIKKGDPNWVDPESLYASERIFSDPDPNNPNKFPQQLNPLKFQQSFFQIMRDNSLTSQFQIQLSNWIMLPIFRELVENPRNWNTTDPILKLLVASHGTSGAEEKRLSDLTRWPTGDPKNVKIQPSKNNTFSCTAFGFEDQSILTRVNLKTVRDSLVNNIYPIVDFIKNNPSKLDEPYWQENYPKVVEEFSKAYKFTVGDTQRPVNDVTLWDATSLASTLFKSALVKTILEGWSEPIDSQNKQSIIKWKILRINLDVLAIMAKGIKIGDILSYRQAVDDSLSECKKIIEVKYCLGNEIYRDESGVYFSFPDVDASALGFQNDLIKELRYAIQKIEPEFSPNIKISGSISDFKDLTSQRVLAEKGIVYPYEKGILSQNISGLWTNAQQNSEICPICRLRPMKENSEGCKHCLKTRVSRAESWIKKPKQTIWLDEVSDHNDRVALLVGSFGLTDWLNGKLISTMAKKMSSSGRVRRCWETTEEFIQSTVFADILTNFTYGKRSNNLELRKKRIQFKINPNPKVLTGATCDMDLEGVRLSPVCIDENSGTFVSTTDLQILEKWGKTEEKIASNIQGMEVKLKCGEANRWQEGFTILETKRADEKFQDYIPYVQLYDYPDQFMAIVPAYDALDIAKKIVEEYEVQFSKVRDRLPFHIGIIAFHRRTPLYVAMDAGKRLIDAFKKSKEIDARVASPPQEIDSNKDTAYKKFGHKVIKLKLVSNPCYSSVSLEWVVSCSTGDPDQDDEWHPYLRFTGNLNRGGYSFDYDGNGNYVVHVKKLLPHDCIKIEGSYFNLAYLETAAERFKVDDKLRPLDDIKRLDELWNDVEYILKSKNLGISQIYAYWHEIKKRYEEYKGDSVWEDFVRSSLINILKVSPEKDRKDRELFDKLFHATKDGLLDLCLHWNLQVRKIKLEKIKEVKV